MSKRSRKGAEVLNEGLHEAAPRGGSTSGRVMSLAGVAAALDRDRNTIAKWLEQGCPALQRGDRAAGLPWELDLADVVRWLVKRSVADAVDGVGGGDGTRIEEGEAKRRRQIALMVQDETDAAERIGEVVAVSYVTQVVAREYSDVRKSLLSVGSKAGARCDRKPAAQIKETVDGLITAALASLTYAPEAAPDA